MKKTFLEKKWEVVASSAPNRGKTIKHSPTCWEYVASDGTRLRFNPNTRVRINLV